MPRTKVAKNSKRNREADLREEKVNDFESAIDNCLNQLDGIGTNYIEEVDRELRSVLHCTSSVLLTMKVGDFLAMNPEKLRDWNLSSEVFALSNHTSTSQSMLNTTAASAVRAAISSNPRDEGYLTEDSNNGGSSIGSSLAAIGIPSNFQESQQVRGRTPGPLSSARARRPRRSRSACGDYVPSSALKPKPSATNSSSSSKLATSDRTSRNKLRTPTTQRIKAFSADRTHQKLAANSSSHSPTTAFMRWPRPGELVVSTCGSPVVAQVLPDKFANVNIPVRDGVLSLRPKKLSELRPDIIEAIDSETLSQIKTLHANLNMIMNMADKAAALLK